MMIKNHLAGMILLISCKGIGMLVIGKIKPDNKTVGNISPNNESIRAVCWVAATVEINIPRLKAVTINKRHSASKRKTLPLTGTLKMRYAINKMKAALRIDKIINGTNFPTMIIAGFSGETNRISMVPSSFSLVMEMEDNMAETNIKIMVITPGTNIDTLFSSGL